MFMQSFAVVIGRVHKSKRIVLVVRNKGIGKTGIVLVSLQKKKMKEKKMLR
jgi:hypothetical protein